MIVNDVIGKMGGAKVNRIKYSDMDTEFKSDLKKLPDRELVEDTFRVTSLSLQNLQGAESIAPYVRDDERKGEAGSRCVDDEDDQETQGEDPG